MEVFLRMLAPYYVARMCLTKEGQHGDTSGC